MAHASAQHEHARADLDAASVGRQPPLALAPAVLERHRRRAGTHHVPEIHRAVSTGTFVRDHEARGHAEAVIEHGHQLVGFPGGVAVRQAQAGFERVCARARCERAERECQRDQAASHGRTASPRRRAENACKSRRL